MRFAALLAVLMASVVGANGGADMVFNFVNLTNYPGRSMVVKLTPTPTNSAGLSSGGIVLRDILKFSTDTNGALTVTNLAPWDYIVDATGPYAVTSFRINVPNTNGTIYATNHLSVGIATNGTASAYSIAASDARFQPKSTNLINWASIVTNSVVYLSQLVETNRIYVSQSGTNTIGGGTLFFPYRTPMGAKTNAVAGQTIEVLAGDYTNQNNLCVQGVNWLGQPGANLLYVQTTTNDAGWGFWDDRTSGAYTNTIVWHGDLQFIGATNEAFGDPINGTYDVNLNTLGAFVFTNAASAANVKFTTLKMSGLSPGSGVVGIYSLRGANSFEFDEITDPLIDFFVTEDLTEFHSVTSAVFWGIGDLYFRYKHIGRMGQYGIWGGEVTGAHTNRMEFYGGLTESKLYIDCHSEEYTSWGYVTELRGHGSGAADNAASYYGSGKHYLFFEKLLAGNIGIETAVPSAIPPQVWAIGNKITAGQTWISSGAGTTRASVQHYQDLTGTITSGFLIQTNTTLRVTGGDAAAAGKVVDHRGGKAVIDSMEMRSTNNVVAHVQGPGLFLKNSTLISKTTSNSIYATSAQTVGVMGVLANTDENANITFSPLVSFSVDPSFQ